MAGATETVVKIGRGLGPPDKREPETLNSTGCPSRQASKKKTPGGDRGNKV